MDHQQTTPTSTFNDPKGVLPPVQQALPPDPALAAAAGQAAPALPPVQDDHQDGGQDDIPALPATALPPLAPEAAEQAAEQANAQQTVPDSRALVPVPEEASDGDLIEKEWVVKAKQIVEHTAEDPFRQQEELNKIRADYMKKRYNKDIGTV